MSTRKKVGKNEKRINQTVYQRAMASPEVREALSALRACWSNLSPSQRGEQLSVLKGFKCSVRAIAKELEEPETSIRRYIALANPPEDWISTMERTWARDPKEQSTMSDVEPPCRFPSKIPAKKIVEPVINETSPAQDDAHTSTAQQTKKITSPLSTTVKEPPVVNGAMSRQEVQVGEGTPITGQRDAYRSVEENIYAKRQRLAAMPDQIKPRREFTARSMPRQGKPVPPKDPH